MIGLLGMAFLAWMVGGSVVVSACVWLQNMLLGERVHPVVCLLVLILLWPLLLAESVILAWRGDGSRLDR